jgi:hypothetical protein
MGGGTRGVGELQTCPGGGGSVLQTQDQHPMLAHRLNACLARKLLGSQVMPRGGGNQNQDGDHLSAAFVSLRGPLFRTLVPCQSAQNSSLRGVERRGGEGRT